MSLHLHQAHTDTEAQKDYKLKTHLYIPEHDYFFFVCTRRMLALQLLNSSAESTSLKSMQEHPSQSKEKQERQKKQPHIYKFKPYQFLFTTYMLVFFSRLD